MNSVPSQIHIIAMGPAQLLTAVAALRAQGMDPAGACAFYRGMPSAAIDAVMLRLCRAFQVQYAGLANVNTAVAGRGGLEGMLDACNARISPRHYLKRRLAWVWDALESLRSDITVISVRHNVPEDVFLLAAIEPQRLLFTVDGVIVGAPHTRVLRPAERIAVGALGQGFPLSQEIWTPSYLSSFAEKVGRPRNIPNDILEDVFVSAQVAGSSIAPTGFQFVVLGQHLELSGLATELEEFTVWGDIIRHLSRSYPAARLLYKAHPRDRNMKRVLLSRSFAEGGRVQFTTDVNWALPLEAIQLPAGTHVVGLSSSALLYAAARGYTAKLLCGQHWPEPLVAEITRFGAESTLPIDWIDE